MATWASWRPLVAAVTFASEGIESTYDWFRQNYDRAVLRPEAQTATV